ncbi:flagellar biosynthesis protein [Gemmobacter denitrificans]|uniref:Flagellar biosynthesis protein n=1 Tax=Gemmobacter denitrificans TaxID=3123040 RepID=A0ABU8BZY5_9RHOB
MPGLKLEVFEDFQPTPGSDFGGLQGQGFSEEARLAAYEQGYSAGWEDAANAQSEEQGRLRADLAHNIQALGFTFQEARGHVLRALAPLLQDMVGRLLPEMAREALAPTVLEILMPLAEQMADAPVTIVLNPASRAPVEALLEQATGLPVTIVEEPSLAEGQVFLRLGETETRVDLDRATNQLAAAVRGFFGLSEQE